jgi:aspartyl-tRNA(Asn)/glutamyl-tRNA(Gln) amidotransferase subunit A
MIELTNKVLKRLKELNEEYSFMSVISTDLAYECAEFATKNPNLPLSGYFVTIKDCVVVKDVESTASSRILKGYRPVFDATVVKKIKEAGGIILGKTIQDEFGFGSFSTNVGLDYPTPKNPHNKDCAAGGSSGGSAVATALFAKEGIKHISIAESTGGSIENPASFCGVIGFCPTYGRVSRNGLISYANSLDKIGVMAPTVDETALGVSVISGKDIGDSTSCDVAEIKVEERALNKYKVGIIKESLTEDLNPEVRKAFDLVVENLKSSGTVVEEVSLPFTFKYGIPAYYILAMSEASTNLSCLCGLRYGKQEVKKDEHFSEYFKRIRSQHFGKEAKRRIMLGTFARMAGYRDAFYIRAAKARTSVIEEYKKLFSNFDVLISPTMPFTAPTFSDISKLRAVDHYLADIMTVGPNLAGVPHASFPIGKDSVGMPIGMMVIADHWKEGVVLGFSKHLEVMK